ncbi:hypothetical protein [Leptolyngbya sp. NIES-2104]|uniref:hypothetical protein n=1 Tax=Leptolyngbya sp. NIES-2104 TaxID=1552121 RepID=UPI00073E2DD2|nr:hypothetical protein [Leptolyngbya sp. NIES-2104]
MSFNDVVEKIKNLSFEEKQEVQRLLIHYLREERRDEMYNNYQQSRLEEQNGKLSFTSAVSQLKQLIL